MIARADRLRQVVSVAAALFQIVTGFLIPFAAAAAGGAPVRPLIQPADYAFIIWLPIFLLSLAYAVYQSLPTSRERPLLRDAGWFICLAFCCNGLFELCVSLQQFIIAQAFIVGAFLCAGIAYLRIARMEGKRLDWAERLLVALPAGLFFGWITAATVVNAVGVAVLLGLPGGGRAEIVLGSGLLLLGGLFASAIILIGKDAPSQGYVAYAAAILWAFVGIIVAQNGASLAIMGVALLAGVPVVVAPLRRAWW